MRTYYEGLRWMIDDDPSIAFRSHGPERELGQRGLGVANRPCMHAWTQPRRDLRSISAMLVYDPFSNFMNRFLKKVFSISSISEGSGSSSQGIALLIANKGRVHYILYIYVYALLLVCVHI